MSEQKEPKQHVDPGEQKQVRHQRALRGKHQKQHEDIRELLNVCSWLSLSDLPLPAGEPEGQVLL